MTIGDRVYVQGYVDEIRKDTVIIRNRGGYFGTIPDEIIEGAEYNIGKWLYHTYMPHSKYCSLCEHDSPYNRSWKFCPHCGAEMNISETIE